MTDKTRHRNRHLPTPHGHLSNWVLAALAVGIAAIGFLLTRVS